MAKRYRVINETMERLCDRCLRRRIDQQLRRLIRKIISSGSVYAPVLAQCFGAGEDFFRDDVDGATIFRQCYPKRLRGTLLEFFEIITGQVETIGMVDAKACHRARAHQIQKKAVNGIKYLW